MHKLSFPEAAALLNLETLAAANPRNTKILRELGEFYLSIGENEKAIETYQRIAQIYPCEPSPNRTLFSAS